MDGERNTSSHTKQILENRKRRTESMTMLALGFESLLHTDYFTATMPVLTLLLRDLGFAKAIRIPCRMLPACRLGQARKDDSTGQCQVSQQSSEHNNLKRYRNHSFYSLGRKL